MVDVAPRGFEGIASIFPVYDFDDFCRKTKTDLAERGKQAGTSTADNEPSGQSEAGVYKPKKVIRSFNIPKGYWWIAVVVFFFWIANQDDKKPHASSGYNAPSYQKPADPEKYTSTETAPPVGTNNVLSYAQIRYCLSQKVRIEEIQSDLDRTSNYELSNSNSLIDDYNSRCSSFRYPEGSLEAVQKQVDAKHSSLTQEGLEIVQGWRM